MLYAFLCCLGFIPPFLLPSFSPCPSCTYSTREFTHLSIYSFLKDFIYLFCERGKGGTETSIGCLPYAPRLGTWPTTQARALTGNRTGDVLLDDAQRTATHRSGPSIHFQQTTHVTQSPLPALHCLPLSFRSQHSRTVCSQTDPRLGTEEGSLPPGAAPELVLEGEVRVRCSWPGAVSRHTSKK